MKLLIIGLDCADPELVFGWKDEFPNLKKLIENGAYGKLRSTHPPITVPAWAVMMSGKDLSSPQNWVHLLSYKLSIIFYVFILLYFSYWSRRSVSK